MRHFRRTQPELRIELTPLVDVVFLLLTFFVFSLAVMVRANVLDITLPDLAAAGDASDRSPLTIAVNADGRIVFAGEPLELDELVARITEARREDPDQKIVVASDAAASAEALLGVIDRLTQAGVRDFGVLARPRDGTAPADPD